MVLNRTHRALTFPNSMENNNASNSLELGLLTKMSRAAMVINKTRKALTFSQ